MLKEIFLSEFIKLKKNINFYFYLFIFFIAYTIFGFVFHLTRIGSTGNLNIPLNISYGGFIFFYGFVFSFFLFSLIFDSDIKDEIQTNKIYFLLTQVINRKEFYFGKIFTIFIFYFVFSLILFIFSYIIASFPFPKLPVLLDGQYLNKEIFILNSLVNFIFLIPLFFLISNLIFFTGYFFNLSSLTLIFYILLVSIFIFFPFNSISNILIPFKNLVIHNNRYYDLKIFDFSLVLYLIKIIIINIIFIAIILKNLNKREFY
jgi:hypothetical protein